LKDCALAPSKDNGEGTTFYSHPDSEEIDDPLEGSSLPELAESIIF